MRLPAEEVGELELVPTIGGSPGVLSVGLTDALKQLAARPQVLVALDFDGVLAPIVRDPDAARPLPASAAAVRRLAVAPGVRLALVSGRTLADLRRLADPPATALLVGSHGAQCVGVEEDCAGQPAEAGLADDVIPGMDDQAEALLARVTSALEQISERHPGTFVERKPAGVVLHTRQAPRSSARRATEEALSGPSSWAGVHLTRGKEVVDLSVVDANKGIALATLRNQVGLRTRGGGVLYVGDDVTDERAFAVLDDDRGDITVKVGDGPSIARHRLDGPDAVGALLTLLADLRGC